MLYVGKLLGIDMESCSSRTHTQDLEGSAYMSVSVFVPGNDTRSGVTGHPENYFGVVEN